MSDRKILKAGRNEPVVVTGAYRVPGQNELTPTELQCTLAAAGEPRGATAHSQHPRDAEAPAAPSRHRSRQASVVSPAQGGNSPPRPQTEQPILRLRRMFAALSATNEAILRTTSPEELYQKVCDAAVYGGEFIAAAVMLSGPEADGVRIAAASGQNERLRQARISVDEACAEGRGLVGTAFRTGQPCIANDFLTDERTQLWRAEAQKAGAGAAFPLLRADRAIGVLLLYSRERDAFDVEIVGLLERMAENVVFALLSFEREAERERAEQVLRQFRAAMDMSGDAIYLTDPTSMRFVDVNETACSRMGYSRQQLLAMGPLDLLLTDRNALRQAYDHVIAQGSSGVVNEAISRSRDGRERVAELHRRALVSGDTTIIVTISRDITKRKRVEGLVALEHAVTRSLAEADSSRKILQAVMRVVCESEQWESAGYFRVEDELGTTRLIAGWRGAGTEQAATDYYKNTLDAVIAPGGWISKVIQGAKPLWLSDMKESHTNWTQRIDRTGERATFSFPVLADGKVIGVLAFSSRAIREPDESLLQTARRIGEQVGQFLQRKQAQQVLRESEARFRALTDLSSDWYWEIDSDFRFTRIEGRHVEGGESLPGENILGRRRWETGLEIDAEGGWDAHRALLNSHEPYRDVVMYRLMPDGMRRYISASGEPIHNQQGGFIGYRGVGRDITDRKTAENRIQHLATHDGLTLLPNRVMFSELLNLAIRSAQRHGHKVALLFIDLDRFKLINDTLGHEAGDVLLKAMSLRLKDCLRSSDVVARLGGDEFVVLIPQLNEPNEAATVARKILSAAAKPILMFGQECRVTASIGISMYPADAEDEQGLMKNADIAMYLAKEEGKNNFQFYSKDIKSQSSERLTLETNLRRALERDEFSILYQAKVDLKTGAIAGVEALLRWQNPDLGVVAPALFIPLAEETGLILPIGQWVLRTACAQNMAWQRLGLPALCMAVNLSARQFADEFLLGDIAGVLRETGMKPELLELEIAEGMVIQNPERTMKLLTAIRNMGVRLAVDDFGTGYSSLAQLKRFPIHTLKVDRSFIRDIPRNAEDKAITQAIIAMGKTLHLTVVAEGVETQEQAFFLREQGCDQMQGYYFSRPVAADQFAELLSEHVAAPKWAP